MTSNWDPTTGLDDTSRRVRTFFEAEIAALQLANVTVVMKPISANDRNPAFVIHTPNGSREGSIAQETAALETETELRKIIRAHLLGV